MKNFTLFPLQSYRTKLAGITITVISLILIGIEKMSGIIAGDKLKTQKFIQIATLLIIIGLFLVIFSKEKIDDDRVKKVRLKSLQLGFATTLAIIISLIFVSIVHPAFSFGVIHDLSMISLISLIVYLLFFNIGLYFDLNELYNDDTSLANVNKNRLFFLVYTLGLSVIVFFLLII